MAVLSLKRSSLGAGFFALACFPLTDGDSAPLNALNFPTAVALSSGGNRLYVVNNDTDLQYNSGSLLVLDAERIRKAMPQACWTDADCSGGRSCDADAAGQSGTFLCVDKKGSPCGDLGVASAADQSTAPAPCGPLELDDSLVIDGARIAPFVSDVQYVRWTEAGKTRARIVMPSRGDATLHWADVEDDLVAADKARALDCGQRNNTKQECDADHRRGNDPSERTPAGAYLATEPSGIAVSRDGHLIVMGHQNPTIKASVFVNTKTGPELSYVLGGLGTSPMAVAAVPPPRYATLSGLDYSPGFLMTYQQDPEFGELPRIDLLRYVDEASAPAGVNPYLLLAGSATVTTNSPGTDCRGIAVDAEERDACESACDPTAACTSADTDCVACLKECSRIPLDVFAANRAPSTLLVGKTRSALTRTSSDDLPDFSNAVALRGGPADIVVGKVIGKDGQPERRVFAVASEARFLYVYDPRVAAVEVRIQTGNGPQGFVLDERRGLGYIAHQRDSYIGVVDLDRRRATYGQILLNVGRPSAPRSSR
jgi:hypothetical protein